MLVAVLSVTGAPGVTSTSLAAAAVWTRPVVLVEADPSGGDLAYRCPAEPESPASGRRDLLSLAADLRGGHARPHHLASHTRRLVNQVPVVLGVASGRQAAALGEHWRDVAAACACFDGDVIVDLGRLEPGAPLSPVLASADLLVTVARASLESVMHLADGLPEIASAVSRRRTPIVPLLVTRDARAEKDCRDLDVLLASRGLDVHGGRHLPLDAAALLRLERGERVNGRLSRTLLVRQARTLADEWLALATTPAVDAAVSPGGNHELAAPPSGAARWLVRGTGATP